MKGVMAIATAAAAFLSLQVGSAQQPSSLRFNATTVNDLRTWDQFVSAQERAGGLRVTRVEQDPSLPSRTVERMRQYYQGIPVWGAEVVRDSDGGVPVSIFGDVSAQFELDTQPALTVDAATKVFLSSAASATLLRPVNLVVLRQGAQPRLAYTTVVSGGNTVNHVFIDARSGAELLRYDSIQTQEAVGTGRGVIGDTKKLSVLRQAGAYVADDQLRPPVLTTFDLRGNLARALNVSLLGAPLFASDVASDSDNDWTDSPVVDAHAYVGWTRPDSRLGIPGVMEAYKKGRVAIVNAPGTGVSDDKAIYAYVPKIINYYLAEEPVLPNVPTYVCWERQERAYVLDHLDQLVVKATNEAGGYGMMIGPRASKQEREDCARRIQADPRNYIAQPTLALSRVPTLVEDHIEGRHVDLRPYVLFGRDVYVMPGGMTRVALRKGSLVVNSSQGGGNKDTWVLS